MRAKANKWMVPSVFAGLFAGWAIHGLFSGNLVAEYYLILYSLYAGFLGFGIFIVRHILLDHRLERAELLEKLKWAGKPNPIGISSK
jgi:Ni/Fe-hydrogenase subunit HybB-like protein